MNTSSMMNIPVLTEVIAPPPVTDATADKQAVPPSQDTAAAAPGMPGFPDNKLQWDELERRLTERLLQLVQERIDFILSHAIKDSVAFALQKATEELATEIRNDLQRTLEVVVSHVVSQEIGHLQQGRANMSDNV